MNSVDQQCVLCNSAHSEDIDHLLLHRPFSQAIWRYFFPQQHTSMMQFASLLSWVQTWQSHDSQINIHSTPHVIHIIVCIMHFIGIHRCRVIFSNLSPNHTSVIHQVSFYIAKHQLHAASSIPAFVRSVVNDAWKPPPLNVLKINIDASYSPLSLLAGIGIIIRNDAGQYVAGKSTVRRAIDIHQAEAWDLLEAMEMTTSNGWSNVVFETDNLNISSYVNNKSSLPPSQSKILLKKCVHICNRNVMWSCVFVYRGCNKVADALVKAARKHHLCGEWWFNPPALLFPYLENASMNASM
ncbi:uncharacterized protein LOC113352266 [Papaver somniferum]|uniref:uncharacterized protein LOC113352266 n=1 Tax=Papaver somniferum TaxID=3469 RepID=UPI000E6FD6CB|nr:uncharacterized protein LOC113352266 [Papaver somniferum]